MSVALRVRPESRERGNSVPGAWDSVRVADEVQQDVATHAPGQQGGKLGAHFLPAPLPLCDMTWSAPTRAWSQRRGRLHHSPGAEAGGLGWRRGPQGLLHRRAGHARLAARPGQLARASSGTFEKSDLFGEHSGVTAFAVQVSRSVPTLPRALPQHSVSAKACAAFPAHLQQLPFPVQTHADGTQTAWRKQHPRHEEANADRMPNTAASGS